MVTDDEPLRRRWSLVPRLGTRLLLLGRAQRHLRQRFSQQFGTLPFGYDHKYVYSHIGYNLKVTDIQAAIGSRSCES